MGTGSYDYDSSLEATSFYVVINHNLVKLESALKAIDICFKSFFSLHVNYPCECEQIWEFIQKFFYKINTKFDKNYQFVTNLITTLIK